MSDISKNDFDANLVIGAKKFWESTGRQEHLAITEEMRYFTRVGPDGVLRSKDECFENVEVCPLCSSSMVYYFLERLVISIFRCKECGFGFQNPRVKYSVVKEIYKDEKTTAASFETEEQKKMDRIKYKYGYKKIKSALRTDMHTVLDIGCGNGMSLDIALEEEWKHAVGIEPNKNYKYHKRPCKKIINEDITSFSTGEEEIDININAIMCWDVLEHIYDLDGFMEKVKKLLISGGVFLVMVPNLDSLASRLIRERSSTFCWEHVNYFTKTTLETLLLKNSFEIVESETVISEIGNINNYLAFDDPYTGDSEGKILFDFLNPDLIHDKFLGSRLLVIARKLSN